MGKSISIGHDPRLALRHEARFYNNDVFGNALNNALYYKIETSQKLF